MFNRAFVSRALTFLSPDVVPCCKCADIMVHGGVHGSSEGSDDEDSEISQSELSTDSDGTEHAEEYTGMKPSGSRMRDALPSRSPGPHFGSSHSGSVQLC